MCAVLFTLGLLAALAAGGQASAQINTTQPQNFGGRLPSYASFGSGVFDLLTSPVRAISSMPSFRNGPQLGKHQYDAIPGLNHPPTYLRHFGFQRMRP